MNDDLPPLPEPAHESAPNFGQPYAPFFTADQMRAYGDARAAAATEQRIHALERLVIDAAYTLDKARIWNGMGWTYNPLHPIHYTTMRERLHNECNNIEAARAAAIRQGGRHD